MDEALKIILKFTLYGIGSYALLKLIQNMTQQESVTTQADVYQSALDELKKLDLSKITQAGDAIQQMLAAQQAQNVQDVYKEMAHIKEQTSDIRSRMESVPGQKLLMVGKTSPYGPGSPAADQNRRGTITGRSGPGSSGGGGGVRSAI